MEEEEILIGEEDEILKIILNRPGVRNALTTSMMEEISPRLRPGRNLQTSGW